jgi:hypothetical protein
MGPTWLCIGWNSKSVYASFCVYSISGKLKYMPVLILRCTLHWSHKLKWIWKHFKTFTVLLDQWRLIQNDPLTNSIFSCLCPPWAHRIRSVMFALNFIWFTLCQCFDWHSVLIDIQCYFNCHFIFSILCQSLVACKCRFNHYMQMFDYCKTVDSVERWLLTRIT